MLFRLALRNLVRNRRRTLLTVSALVIGVAAVTGVRGLLNGLQGSLIRGVTEGGVGALQIHASGFVASRDALPLTPDLPDDPALYARIAAVPGVRAVAPRIPFAGLVSDESGGQSGLAVLIGVDLEREAVVSAERKKLVVAGAWPQTQEQAAMGIELAKALSLRSGAKIAVLGNDRDGVLNGVEVEITGHLSAPTMAEKKLVVMPLAKVQELLRMPGRVTEIAVAVDADADADRVADDVRAVLGPQFEVHTWKQIMPFANDARRLQDQALLIVTLAFLVVVLMGVANTLLMNVLERTREIGTLLALGMKRATVLRLFLLEGALIALAGALIGSALGGAIVAVLSRTGIRLLTPGASMKQLIVPTLTWDFPPTIVLLVLAGALVASFFPALRASRLDPVAALADR